MEAKTFVVVIVDNSTAFDLSQAPESTNIEASLENRPLGGLGLFLVHQMMDSVGYRRVEGCNIVTLTKETDAGADSDTGQT